MTSDNTVRVAIAGIGNCASSLLQGIEYYKSCKNNNIGLMHQSINGIGISDIKPVAAFDIDSRKVGEPLHKAIFSRPNCTKVFYRDISDFGVTVKMGPLLDGVASHMEDHSENPFFSISDKPSVDIVHELINSKADVMVCYLPVGAEKAAKAYAQACLDAKVALINCMPVFIASNPKWSDKFTKRGIPIIGDDIKSQFGATILHRILTKTLVDRGAEITKSYQINIGGNTDFKNMLHKKRLKTKMISKTEAVQSQLNDRMPDKMLHIGPSDFVPWLDDNKIAFVRIEWEGFGGVPMNMEARLSVEDSPNSAGIVVDALRFTKIALNLGLKGPLKELSAYYMKHPPFQMNDNDALNAITHFLQHGKWE